jgi:hypothetical protein
VPVDASPPPFIPAPGAETLTFRQVPPVRGRTVTRTYAEQGTLDCTVNGRRFRQNTDFRGERRETVLAASGLAVTRLKVFWAKYHSEMITDGKLAEDLTPMGGRTFVIERLPDVTTVADERGRLVEPRVAGDLLRAYPGVGRPDPILAALPGTPVPVGAPLPGVAQALRTAWEEEAKENPIADLEVRLVGVTAHLREVGGQRGRRFGVIEHVTDWEIRREGQPFMTTRMTARLTVQADPARRLREDTTSVGSFLGVPGCRRSHRVEEHAY